MPAFWSIVVSRYWLITSDEKGGFINDIHGHGHGEFVGRLVCSRDSAVRASGGSQASGGETACEDP